MALKELVEAAAGTKDKAPAAKPVALVILVLVMLVVAGLAAMAFFNRRKRALAHHEAEKLVNDLRQKREVFDKLDRNAAERKEAVKRIADLERKRNEVQDRIKVLDEGRKDFEKKLSAVTSWDDVA